MFKINVFPEKFRNILTSIKPIEIQDSSKSTVKPVIFLLKQCEQVFFSKNAASIIIPETDIEKSVSVCLDTVKVILDITWEHINTGCWKDVDLSWRYIYSYASLFKVLCMILDKEPNIKEIIKTCDMGLLMGAPILDNILCKLASEISSFYIKESSIAYEETNKVKKMKYDGSLIITNKKVEERKWLPCKEFEESFVKLKKPVIILNAIRHWPAFSSHQWSIDYLLEKARYRTVPVEIGSKYTDENWTQKLMTIEEFISNYMRNPSGDGNIGYLAQHNLFSQIPELMEDIKIPIYIKSLWGDEANVDINCWFGPCGTISPLHFDPKHNFLVQVIGEKYVKLYAKENTPYLYPRENTILSNTSQVDAENPNLELYPLFSKAESVECVLRPGSMLYIPPECWHYVRSLSVSFSVSFWW